MINPFWFVLTVLIFKLTQKFQTFKYTKKFPPILVSGIILIIILKVFKIDYSEYNESACFITFLLGPATIALAYPLVKNIDILTKNKRAVYFGLLFAALIAIISTYLTGKFFHADFNVIMSMIPKSVTTPIAVEISKTIGGIPELTGCIVIFTGLLGGLSGHKILKIFHIKSDVAVGLSIGASSHVMGTASCIEKKKHKQVAISTMALIIVGILTAIMAPILVSLIK